MTTQLSLHGISKSYGDRLVLDHVSLAVRPGERAGVVGENGSGKSTLLRIMAGIERPDEGSVISTGTGYLGQTLDLPGSHTVQQAVDAALSELRAMERAMQAAAEAEDMTAYGDLLTVFEARGGYEADARVDKSLHGLGLAHVAKERRLDSLSGGEQARLGLACLLAAAPEVMLLDEPTNHLDDSSTAWLEERLREHRGTVVAVSHDRAFLDGVATAIIEVAEGGVTRFGGGYSGFLAEKAAARQRWEQAHQDWLDEVEEVRRFAATTAHRVAAGRGMKDNNKMAYDRNAGRVQSSVASRVRNAQERLRRLEEKPVPRPPRPLRFAGAFAAGGSARTLVELPELTIGPGDRLLITGPNGAGKSTLLRKVAAAAKESVSVGHLRQDDSFEPGASLLARYAEGLPGDPDEHRAKLLATGLFAPESLGVRVEALSVGQRRRLALARLLADEHDLLLLDEPTNHLSLTLVEELERALDAYRGALVVVSHDRTLHERFRGARWRLEPCMPL
ncbi:ribosomal protection-like ABC-F family protein [Nonomuraea dietziae]|uniref:ribosomal protection-like ABC-F family protein n=1 Tax=Nonomuraea dietziae TaxID=65515 RepID=UPI00340337E1